jgi:hypothetical protein
MGGLFAEYQPQYAERGIATFPVNDNKVPAVSHYLRMGLPASRQMAAKFGAADALGFACGKRSGITVLDVDSPDERLLAEALDDYGPSPFIVRSGSGNFQAWYRHNGEGRKIRPDKSRPIDLLGGGYVVAPPSRSGKGDYSIIEGTLDDLAALPRLRAPSAPVATRDAFRGGKVERGKRNDSLWRQCMKQAPSCPDIESLLGVAVNANKAMFYEPLPDEEVLRIVASAWAKEANGENGFGRRSLVMIPLEQIDTLLNEYPDAFILLAILRSKHWGREFICANAMADSMPRGGWTRQRFAAARRVLEQTGEIELVRAASRQHGPAIYRLKGVQYSTPIDNLHPSPSSPPNLPAGDFQDFGGGR